MKLTRLWLLPFLLFPILSKGQNCAAPPPPPYVGESHAACGCESATAKAQHRDPLTFQALPNKTIVWYSNPTHQGTALPSSMQDNISLCSSSNFPVNLLPLTKIYAFEVENGCYSAPSAVDITAFPLPTSLPKIFQGNEELNNFATLRSCEPITLRATPSTQGGRVSWYASSNRGQLLGTGETYSATTSGSVFVFDEPQNNLCGTGDVLTCYGTPKQINVIILPKPTVDLGADLVQCRAGDIKTLSANVGNTATPFEYVWNTGANSTSISVSTPNKYSLSVTNISIINNIVFRCTSSDEVLVSVSNLAISAGDDQAICTATTPISPIVSGGKAPFSFIWSNGTTTPSVNVGSGNYSVTVTDRNGCSSSDDVLVSAGGGSLSATINQVNNLCNGAKNGKIVIIASSSTPPFSYSINNGASWSAASHFPDLAAGEYIVRVRDINNCSYKEVVKITEPTAINFAPSTTANCASGSIKIENVTGGNGAPYTYSTDYGSTWQSLNTFSNLPFGTYQTRVRDASLCRSIVIKPVVLAVAATIKFKATTTRGQCGEGETITISQISGGAEPYEYSSDGGRMWQSSPVFINKTSGIYSLKVRDANLCTSNTLQLWVLQKNISAQITQKDNLCYEGKDGRIFIAAQGGQPPYSYSINNGDSWFNTSNFYALAAGTYSIKIKDTEGCVFSKTINLQESTPITYTATVAPISCKSVNDGKITFTAVSGGRGRNYTYSLNYGHDLSNSNIFKYLETGTYNLRVRDSVGCFSAIQKIEVKKALPITFETTIQNVTCGSNSNGIIAISNVKGGESPYRYSKIGGNTYQTSNSFLFLPSGSYPIRIKDNSGCESPTRNVVVSKNCNNSNSLQQTTIIQKIPVVIYAIAPNPSDQYIRIELNSLTVHEQEFQFFDAFGKPVLTETRLLEQGIQRVEFDITKLPQGVYEVITTGSYGKNIHNRFVRI